MAKATAKATLDALRAPRTKTVEVTVDGKQVEFVIAKLKVGQRRNIADAATDERGYPDLDKASRLAAAACCVEPVLTEEDIDEIDTDVFLELSDHIAVHSGLLTIAQIVTPDPEEGSDAVKGFRHEEP